MSERTVMSAGLPTGVPAGEALINFAAHQVRANVQGARQDFEEMVAQLVRAVLPGARMVAANPGDWGIDVLVGDLGGAVTVWQSKYFVPHVNKSHRTQIQESFHSAVDNANKKGFTLTRWILCVPSSMDAPTTKWWDGWKRQKERESKVVIDLWDETELRSLLISPAADSVRRHYYGPAQAAPSSHSTRTQSDLPVLEPSAEAVVVPVAGTRSGTLELFVGRDPELDALMDCVRPGKRMRHRNGEADTVVVSAVAGMGGIGKTMLAQRVASVAVDREWFPGGVVMVNLRGYDPDERRIRPGQVYAPLLRVLGVPSSRIPSTKDEQAATYHLHLKDLAERNRPVLLVLDNASTDDQVLDLLPRHAAHRVLVTTRDTLTLPSSRQVELDVFSEDEALRLLSQVVRQKRRNDIRMDRELKARERLVNACGLLPLAIKIAAALLVDDPDMTVAELVEDLADSATRLKVLQHGDTAVARVIDLSWRHLQRREPDAARLLRLLTLDLGPDISPAACAALADSSVPLVNTQLRALRQAHLLQTSNGRWRMHDLVRLHVHATRVEDDGDHAAVTRLQDYYLKTARAANDHFQPPSQRASSTLFASRSAAEEWLDTNQPTLAATVARATADGRNEFAVELAVLVCDHLSRRRDGVKMQLSVARHANTAAVALSDPDRSAMALDLLGMALHYCGQSDEAEVRIRKALTLWQGLDDHDGQRRAWNNLAIVLEGLGRHDDAVDAYSHALAMRRDEVDQEYLATVTINLASTLRTLQRFDEAIVQCHRALALSRKTGYRDEEGRAWNELGRVLRETRRYTEAIEAFRSAQAAFRESDDRVAEGLASSCIAETLVDQERISEAIPYFSNAIKAYQSGRDRYLEASAWNDLGLSLYDERRFRDAVHAYTRAQRLWRELEDRKQEGVTWYNRGIALHQDGRLPLAIAAYDRAHKLAKLTEDGIFEAEVLEARSAVLHEQGKNDEAQRDLHEAQTLRSREECRSNRESDEDQVQQS